MLHKLAIEPAQFAPSVYNKFSSSKRPKRPFRKKILMLHSENRVEEESAATISRRERIGLILLAFFSTVYFGFIFLCAFANDWFASVTFLEVPATVWYGFGLIALALVIAGVYGRLSRASSK